MKRGLQPSTAVTVRGGYAVFADYFAGSHAVTGQSRTLFSMARWDRYIREALAFNDQYVSTAGCMYLIGSGTYRVYADLRPVAGRVAARSGRNAACVLILMTCARTSSPSRRA